MIAERGQSLATSLDTPCYYQVEPDMVQAGLIFLPSLPLPPSIALILSLYSQVEYWAGAAVGSAHRQSLVDSSPILASFKVMPWCGLLLL